MEYTLRQLSEMENITIEHDLSPGSERWDYRIRYTKPDWYSLYNDEYEEVGFYRGEFPTYCRVKIGENK